MNIKLTYIFDLYKNRKAKLNITSKSTRIKLTGVIVSIIGAITVAVYLGPSMLPGPIIGPIMLRGTNFRFVFVTATEEWMFGTSLLALATFFIAIWSMIQVHYSILSKSY